MEFLTEYFDLILIGGLLLAPFILYLANRPKGSKRELTGHATVISRRTEYTKIATGRYNNNWNYRVVFQAGNQMLDLYVTQSEFPQLKEGTTGQLTWQYENLISFVPDEV